MALLKEGAKAPAFTLKDQDEKKVALSSYKGSWVVLYFYPKDDTPGCTIEAKDFTKENPGLEELDAAVLGVSADDCGSHGRFVNKYKLKITLLSDPEKKVIKKYKAWGKKEFMGRKFTGIIRTTYLIDPKGKVAHVWEKVNPAGHAKDVKAKLIELAGGK